MSLPAPEPLGPRHSSSAFDCGDPSLNRWLRQRALANQASGATRTFVVCDEAGVIKAYVALASGAVAVAASPGRFRRNMPDPIPVVVLARLAVDRGVQGKGLARALLADAFERVTRASEQVGVRGILVHAISAKARAFYLHMGFDPSPLDPATLMVRLSDLREVMASCADTAGHE